MLIYKKCAVCRNKDTANHMTSKLTWKGTYRWVHRECAALEAAEERKAEVITRVACPKCQRLFTGDDAVQRVRPAPSRRAWRCDPGL